jgi:hypothetical protein
MSSSIIAEEYKTLRDEHAANRKFIFERPIVIVGVFGFALRLSNPEYPEALTIALLIALLFNLWFTFNRL